MDYMVFLLLYWKLKVSLGYMKPCLKNTNIYNQLVNIIFTLTETLSNCSINFR